MSESRLRRLESPVSCSGLVHDVIIDDALRPVALLRTQREIDPARIFVLGHSLGRNDDSLDRG
jgi:hypothetical protein